MTFEMDSSTTFAFVTAVVLTLFAVVVGWIGRFRGAPLWFMMFEGGFGLMAVLTNLRDAFTSDLQKWYEYPAWISWFRLVPPLAVALAVTGLWLLVHRFPTPISDRDKRRRVWALVPMVAIFAAEAADTLDALATAPPDTDRFVVAAAIVSWLSFDILLGCMLGGVLVLAMRYAAGSPPERSQMALMAAAMSIYPTMNLVGGNLATAASGDFPDAWWFFVGLAAAACLAGAWMLNTRGPGAAAARNVALVLVAAPMAAMVGEAVTEDFSSSGVARILAILILSFAVLRHQILGIDVKVRFAISKSTVAAVFIAVFFIASEAAQQFFGKTSGSTYIGIGIAGTLVFAMAPLQRAAEKLAARAVPVTDSSGSSGAGAKVHDDREEMYRDAVEFALRDRKVTREEEVRLFRLARGLQLTPDRAHAILLEVERETHVRRRKPA